MSEEWRDVNGFEGAYQISNNGELRSIGRFVKKFNKHMVFLGAQRIKPQMAQAYWFVSLRKDNKYHSHYVHRLVAETFLGKRESRLVVNHKDGNKLNNHISNLEWVTPSENTRHACRNNLIKYKRGAAHHSAKIDEIKALTIITLGNSGLSYLKVAATGYCPAGTAQDILRGKSWAHLDNLKTTLKKKLAKSKELLNEQG